MHRKLFSKNISKIGLMAAIIISLSACEEGKAPNLFKGKSEGGGLFSKNKNGGGLFGNKTSTSTEISGNGSIKLVERDVESPEVFQTTEKALWDGRPSLGGVWVAHPDSKQPERVIIRNKTNGKFVIGALFKRERDNPGPKLQLSSDAASALGVLAGAPTTLNVTVLRRETINVNEGNTQPATPETVVTEVLAPSSTEQIEDKVLKSVAKAEAEKTTPSTTTPSTTTPKKTVAINTATPASASSSLSQPYIQLGFFSVEKNAQNTLKALETRKIPGTIVKATAKGKTFWRVLAGPAQTKGERESYQNEIKKMGFSDAYLTKK